jgi:hypothetical protein
MTRQGLDAPSDTALKRGLALAVIGPEVTIPTDSLPLVRNSSGPINSPIDLCPGHFVAGSGDGFLKIRPFNRRVLAAPALVGRAALLAATRLTS